MGDLITLNDTSQQERYLTEDDITYHGFGVRYGGTFWGLCIPSQLKLTSLYTKDGRNILPFYISYILIYDNNLTNLCDLPPEIEELHCGKNLLISLPYLPSKLRRLTCEKNKLKLLPDLPNTLTWVDFTNNPLEENYPEIFTFNRNQTREIVAYVNNRNILLRAKARMRQIDPTNQILEHYMRRAMHPSRIASLANDETIDVDECMNKYVESL